MPSRMAQRGRSSCEHGAWPLHRRVRHARRAGASGPARQRPRQRVDPRLQVRPRHPARLRRGAAAQHPDRRRRRRPRPGVEIDRQATDWRPQPTARPRSRSTSRSPARASSPSRARNGLQYTRNGRFSAAPDGTLTTATGETVMGRNGQPVRVGADGTVARRSCRSSADQPAQGRRGLRHRPAGAQVPRHAVQRRARGLRLDPARAMVDMIASHARVRVRPACHPHDRRHARQGRERGRPAPLAPSVQPRRGPLKYRALTSD